jgi:hypothetical protein
MTIKYYPEIEQGSEEWLALRCGILTASEMKQIITAKTLKYADNPTSRSYLNELAAQRVTRYVEPSYISDDMLRGGEDETAAVLAYGQRHAPVEKMGFVTNDKWGFVIGCSPDGLVDGLVGGDGGIECKSRRQKHQFSTIATGEVPAEHIMQVQTSMLVTERPWWDYVSYCRGMPMDVIRARADPQTQLAIEMAAFAFENAIRKQLELYNEAVKNRRLIQTKRVVEQEMFI